MRGYHEILKQTDPDKPDASILALKAFVQRHPEFLFRGVRQMVALYVYGGRSKDARRYVLGLPDTRLVEKAVAWHRLKESGYPFSRKETESLLAEIEVDCRRWDRITMGRQFLLDVLQGNERKIPKEVSGIPIDEEVRTYRILREKVKKLDLEGLHELVRRFPVDSDFTFMVASIFPNTNGAMEQQLSEMIYLAGECRESGNLEAALYLESQVIALEVNYLGESRLNGERYEKIISECRKYAFHDTEIDLVSILALHRIFRSDYEQSLAFSEEAERLARRYHLSLQAGIYAGYAGICYSNLSQYDKALDCYVRACDTLEKRNPDWYWIWRAKLAFCYAAIGDTDIAEKMYLEILKRELKSGQALQAQYTYRNMAELYIRRGELDKARDCLDKVNASAFPGLVKKNKAIFGRLAYASGNYRKAVAYMNQCLSDKAPLDAPTQLETMIDLAAALQELGQYREAEQAYHRAVTYFEHLAGTRFTNLTYRKGFFRQYHRLYLQYISFLVHEKGNPGRAWLLLRDLESGPFQYFAEIVREHLKSILSFPKPNLPVFSFEGSGENIALKKLMVAVLDAAVSGEQTILAGPGGVFQTDGIFYTRISSRNDICKLAVMNGHWAGIGPRDVVLDGRRLNLPEMPDRVLTAILFDQGRLLVGSSTGLYERSDNGWNLVCKEPVVAVERAEKGLVLLVPGKGMVLLRRKAGEDGPVSMEPLYPAISEIAEAVSFVPVSEHQFIVFLPDRILVLDESQILGRIPFTYGIIERVTAVGSAKWLLSTVLNRHFVLDSGQLYQVRVENGQLLAGCRAGETTFYSTDHAVMVETKSPLIQVSLAGEAGYEFPRSMERIGEHAVGIGFRGAGISVHNIENGRSNGFFPVRLEQFIIRDNHLTVYTSSGHVVRYSGIPPDGPVATATFFPSSPIQAVYQLKAGPLVASLSGGGLVQWEAGRPPRFFGRKQGLPAGVTITAMIEHGKKLVLGFRGEIVPFDFRKAGRSVPVPGSVTCFSEYRRMLVAGTTRGVFLIRESGPIPVFGDYATGKVFDLDADGDMLAAATENGVFLKTEAGTYLIPVPELPRFVSVTGNGLLMASGQTMFILRRTVLPVLLRLGPEHYLVRMNRGNVFLGRDRSSALLLDTGGSSMIPVSIIGTGAVELPVSALGVFQVRMRPPFGSQPTYSARPRLLEDGKSVPSFPLHPGEHRFVVAGIAPFGPEAISFDLKLTRQVSPAWWLSGLLGIITAVLLVTRYAKWKKGRYVAHYRILEKLGEGGMGTVYRARDVRNNRTVALKLLNRQVDAVLVERFKREWQILDRIQHPHIIKVYDRGEHMERFFIAMELLNGRTLDEVLEKNGPLSGQMVAVAAMAVAGALEVIHREKIVHRDLKPSNIMYVHQSEKISGKFRPEDFRLMDFGVSKELLRDGLTSDGNLVGTLLYVAPESLSSLTVDHRSDIYALGVTMYELLTGEPPFTDENQVSIYYKILNSQPPPFPDAVRVESGLEAIVFKCLSKEPDQRYQSASELLDALSGIT